MRGSAVQRKDFEFDVDIHSKQIKLYICTVYIYTIFLINGEQPCPLQPNRPKRHTVVVLGEPSPGYGSTQLFALPAVDGSVNIDAPASIVLCRPHSTLYSRIADGVGSRGLRCSCLSIWQTNALGRPPKSTLYRVSAL